MNEPAFLSCEDVEAIHAESIQAFGGSLGLRDKHVLESALAQPIHAYSFRNADVFQMAAAYAYHIAENQPFVDGNKRAALLAALNFRALNGFVANTPVDEFYDATIAIAEKRLDKAGLATIFRQHLAR